jgi:uncharacterized protein YPO0396
MQLLEVALLNASEMTEPPLVEGSEYIDEILMQHKYTDIQRQQRQDQLQKEVDSATNKLRIVTEMIANDYLSDEHTKWLEDRMALLQECDLPPALPKYYNNTYSYSKELT